MLVELPRMHCSRAAETKSVQKAESDQMHLWSRWGNDWSNIGNPSLLSTDLSQFVLTANKTTASFGFIHDSSILNQLCAQCEAFHSRHMLREEQFDNVNHHMYLQQVKVIHQMLDDIIRWIWIDMHSKGNLLQAWWWTHERSQLRYTCADLLLINCLLFYSWARRQSSIFRILVKVFRGTRTTGGYFPS